MLTSINGHNAITNVRKITYSNHNLDLVIIDAYAKLGNILSICSQDNEQKLNQYLTLYSVNMTYNLKNQ